MAYFKDSVLNPLALVAKVCDKFFHLCSLNGFTFLIRVQQYSLEDVIIYKFFYRFQKEWCEVDRPLDLKKNHAASALLDRWYGSVAPLSYPFWKKTGRILFSRIYSRCFERLKDTYSPFQIVTTLCLGIVVASLINLLHCSDSF